MTDGRYVNVINEEPDATRLVQAMMNGDIFVARWKGSYWNVKTPIIAWMELPEPYCPNCGADMRGGDSNE